MRQSGNCDFPARPGVELVWSGKEPVFLGTLVAEPPQLLLDERHAPMDGATAGREGIGWRDLLVRGDNLSVLRALLAEPWRGRIAAAGGLRLVYLDPPFLTGQEFAAEIEIGDGQGPDGRPRVVRLPAFRDAGPRDLPTYLSEMRERLALIRELLADDGSLYLHCDHRLNAYLRLLLDEVFGPDRFVNELVWHYGLGNPGGARSFARKHDTILLYAKTDRYRFNRLRGDVTRAMANKYRHEDEHGRYMLAYGRKYRLKGGKPFDSVWEIPSLAATDRRRLGFPTQKPETLLERIVLASSEPGHLVADFCCGCGTLPVVAARLGRRWLGCDSSAVAIHLARKRLLACDDRRGSRGRPVAFDLRSLDGWRPDPAPVACEASLVVETVAAGDSIAIHLRNFVPVAIPCDPEAEARSSAPGQRRLVVADGLLWEVGRDRQGRPGFRQLTRHWSDWLDGWAIGVAESPADRPGAEAIGVAWSVVRGVRERTLPLVSEPIPSERPHRRRLLVWAYTILGTEVTVEVAGSPAPGG